MARKSLGKSPYTATMNPDLLKWLDSTATKQRRTRSDIIQELVELYRNSANGNLEEELAKSRRPGRPRKQT